MGSFANMRRQGPGAFEIMKAEKNQAGKKSLCKLTFLPTVDNAGDSFLAVALICLQTHTSGDSMFLDLIYVLPFTCQNPRALSS